MNPDTTIPDISIGGFFPVEGSPRRVFNCNVGWRFCQGDVNAAEHPDFDDQGWAVVSCPHGLELVPWNASGGTNYRGPAWYRKRLTVDGGEHGKRITLHFEAIMGASDIWINGTHIHRHLGGYLPIVLDVTDHLVPGEAALIAVRCDNRDDPSYPPGKPQDALDFTYFGGIYRDVWLITTNHSCITDPNASTGSQAGGGVFVHYEDVCAQRAAVVVDSEIMHARAEAATLCINHALYTADGTLVADDSQDVDTPANSLITVGARLEVIEPALWHVDHPTLHDLVITISTAAGVVLDAVRLRIGIRAIEFRGRAGLFINGEPYAGKLMGGNRHQDFAYLGNALPNALHWRDAEKMRSASMRIVRSAHYPLDPAFMDACDALGLFVIVATPGWQFWNNEPEFEERVIDDIRQMVRRDRNRPSVIMWEPILNETNYPADFAQRAHRTVHAEYPYPGCHTACDAHCLGNEHFDVHFGAIRSYQHVHTPLPDTPESEQLLATQDAYAQETRCVFQREWGDCVDNWSRHNSPSRMHKGWGEAAQLVQAMHYARPAYDNPSYAAFYQTPRLFVGGCLWHTFDHQRGYHPDPFWGGIFDAARQPKYAYWLFKAQQCREPFIFIAHELSPCSGEDIVVFSNCDEVRLRFCGQDLGTQRTHSGLRDMPRRPLVFAGAFDHTTVRELFMSKQADLVGIEAEGLIDGAVVVRKIHRPAGRRSQLLLQADLGQLGLQADGSDIAMVVARLADDEGLIKRLSSEEVRFSVSGAGALVTDGTLSACQRQLEWGEAVALIRTTTQPGTIRVNVELARQGTIATRSASIELISQPARIPLCGDEAGDAGPTQDRHATAEASTISMLQAELAEARQQLQQPQWREVEAQQEAFRQ